MPIFPSCRSKQVRPASTAQDQQAGLCFKASSADLDLNRDKMINHCFKRVISDRCIESVGG